MTLYEATFERHSVRAYQDKPLSEEVVKELAEMIDEINSTTGMHIQLVTNEPTAFKSPMARYGKFSNVSNYIVMVAPKKGIWAPEAVGYYGESLVLTAQTMGVNSCWVGLTYRLKPGIVKVEADEKVHCIIALGYGVDQGKQHKSKDPLEVSNICGRTPEWFRMGVECALNAPTAVNQQKFFFTLLTDNETVIAKPLSTLIGYKFVDLGIAKLHFELGVEEAERQCGHKLLFKWIED